MSVQRSFSWLFAGTAVVALASACTSSPPPSTDGPDVIEDSAELEDVDDDSSHASLDTTSAVEDTVADSSSSVTPKDAGSDGSSSVAKDAFWIKSEIQCSPGPTYEDKLKWPFKCQGPPGKGDCLKTSDCPVKWPPADLPDVVTAVHAIPPVTVKVPAGIAYVGRNKKDCGPGDHGGYYGTNKVYVSDFEMAKYATTVAQYRKCVEAGECVPPPPRYGPGPSRTNHGSFPEGTHDCTKAKGGKPTVYYQKNSDARPVDCVSHAMAEEFCSWLGPSWMLPSMAVWQKAARGGCEFYKGDCAQETGPYPWSAKAPGAPIDCQRSYVLAQLDYGNIKKCGNAESSTNVGSRPAGASPYGCLDMHGNGGELAWDVQWASYCFGVPPFLSLGDGLCTVNPWADSPCAKGKRVPVVAGLREYYTSSFLKFGTSFPPDGMHRNWGFRCVRRGK